MKYAAMGALLLVICAAGYWWWWSAREDDYDYAAAFENLPESDPSADLPLSSFAGKPRAEAEQVLGRPYACEAALHSERCRYANAIEVVYIEGQADWITVSFPYGRYALNPALLQRLGLPETAPSEERQNHLRWTGLAGLREVEAVGDENGALYARIRVRHAQS